jgi:hypothetical protein
MARSTGGGRSEAFQERYGDSARECCGGVGRIAGHLLPGRLGGSTEALLDSQTEVPGETYARGEAARQEMLLYLNRVGARSLRRSRAHRRRVALFVGGLASLVTVFGLVTVGMRFGSLGAHGALDDADHAWQQYVRPARHEGRSPFGTSVSPSIRRGSAVLTNTAYLGDRGSICSSMDTVRDDVVVPTFLESCIKPDALSRRLSDHFESRGWAEGDTELIVRGFMSGNVLRAAGSGPGGSLDFRLSRRWTPGAVGPHVEVRRIAPIRAFIAIGSHPEERSTRYSDALGSLYRYRMTLHLADGRTVRVDSLDRMSWTRALLSSVVKRPAKG